MKRPAAAGGALSAAATLGVRSATPLALAVALLAAACCAPRAALARSANVDGSAAPSRAVKHHFHHQQHASTANNNAAGSGDPHRDILKETSLKSSADTPIGCKELRSKKYISDGPCTSMKPIMEVVCAGICLPVTKLPWYSDLVGYRGDNKEEEEWQCVDDVIKRKRVNLICQDGQERSYVIRTVRSCKCKKRTRMNNKTVKTKRKLQ